MKKNIMILVISTVILLICIIYRPVANEQSIVINVKTYSSIDPVLYKLPSIFQSKYNSTITLNYVGSTTDADLILAHEALIKDKYKKEEFEELTNREDNIVIINDESYVDFLNTNRTQRITLVSNEVRDYLINEGYYKKLITADDLLDKAIADKNINAVVFRSELNNYMEQRYLTEIPNKVSNLNKSDTVKLLIRKNSREYDELKSAIKLILEEEERKNSER
ncbi:hypothetical protein [Clostridium manihotivorum]|uniref:Uncharacterized protein n=1 Tax=Clostridium manihotivorum TaxID=2320868 RepID=A0A3R5VC59_9CLOT|nr:hypothetical protein [Clostridium manihotivorum]QAA35035.1 hypothetical protein C1I91_27185 [Clostridium manihotivorum]